MIIEFPASAEARLMRLFEMMAEIEYKPVRFWHRCVTAAPWQRFKTPWIGNHGSGNSGSGIWNGPVVLRQVQSVTCSRPSG